MVVTSPFGSVSEAGLPLASYATLVVCPSASVEEANRKPASCVKVHEPAGETRLTRTPEASYVRVVVSELPLGMSVRTTLVTRPVASYWATDCVLGVTTVNVCASPSHAWVQVSPAGGDGLEARGVQGIDGAHRRDGPRQGRRGPVGGRDDRLRRVVGGDHPQTGSAARVVTMVVPSGCVSVAAPSDGGDDLGDPAPLVDDGAHAGAVGHVLHAVVLHAPEGGRGHHVVAVRKVGAGQRGERAGRALILHEPVAVS